MDNHSSCWTVLARSFHFAILQFYTSVTSERAVSCFKLRRMNTRYTWLNGIFWNALLQECPDPVLPHYRLSIRGLTILEPVRLMSSTWCQSRDTTKRPEYFTEPPGATEVPDSIWSQAFCTLFDGLGVKQRSGLFGPILTLAPCDERPIEPEQQLSLSLAAQWVCRPRSGRPPSLAEVLRACVGPTHFSTNPISPALELVFPPIPSYSDRKGLKFGCSVNTSNKIQKAFPALFWWRWSSNRSNRSVDCRL